MSGILSPMGVAAGGVLIRTDDGTVMTANYAYCDASAQGETTIVPTQGAGVGIRVLGSVIIADQTVIARFRQSVGGVTYNMSAGMSVAQNGGWVQPFSKVGWQVTSPNAALQIALNNAVITGVNVIWIPSVV